MRRNRFALLFAQLAALWLLAAPPPAQAAPDTPAQFVARCVGVADGDTLTVLLDQDGQKRPLRIRLYGIDAPEKSQAFGTQAKKALSDLAFGKDLTVTSTGRDRYGRLLAWLAVGSTPINAEMVRAGFAWHYRRYAPKEQKLADLEADARANRRGLWIDPAPVAPWEFRKKK
jgi:endonuclease YncB( thermonuclease family)